MTYQIFDDRVLLKEHTLEKEEVSGFIKFTDELAQSKVPTLLMEVVVVGDNIKKLVVADVVVIQKNMGSPLRLDGVDYRVIRESDIEGILKNKV